MAALAQGCPMTVFPVVEMSVCQLGTRQEWEDPASWWRRQAWHHNGFQSPQTPSKMSEEGPGPVGGWLGSGQ